MPINKTWVVTSGRPRASHAVMNGETVPIDEPFSNGMDYPGDPSGGAKEVANCSCVLEIEGQVQDYDKLQPHLEGKPELIAFRDPELQQQFLDKAKEMYHQVGRTIGGESRWDGTVLVGEEAAAAGVGEAIPSGGYAAGVMGWDGRMALSAIEARDAAVGEWKGIKLLVHEIAHSFSRVTKSEYGAGNVALEEGCTEGFARSFCEVVLGDRWAWDSGAYADYVAQFEAVRYARYADMNILEWYTRLMRMNAADRLAVIRGEATL